MKILFFVFVLAFIGIQGSDPSVRNLSATIVSFSALRLQWENNSSDATDFEIERCVGATCTNFTVLAKVSAHTTSFTDAKLKPNTVYRYRLHVSGKDQTASAYSNITGAMTPAPADPPPAGSPIPPSTNISTPSGRPAPSGRKPVAPTNLTATAVSSSQINLTWTRSSDNAASLNLERSLSAKGPWKEVVSVPANSTSSANASLKGSTTYYFRLVASDSKANFAYSNIASATTLSTLPEGAPSHLVATAKGSTQIHLRWTNNAGDATNLKIERCQGSDCSNFTQIASIAANATSYEDTGLSPSMRYSYRVLAYNTALKSGYSNTATVSTARNTNPPTVPTGLIATVVSANRINLKWASATGNGSEVAGYNVYQDGSRIASSVGTTYTVKGLEPKSQYCFTVTAYDQSGNGSGQSDPACATTKSPDDP